MSPKAESNVSLYTDGWTGYLELIRHGYRHERVIQAGRPRSEAHVLLPAVHQVASLLKRWWLGTHQGATKVQHLDYYLDEFTFRFNRRTSKSRGLVFYRLVQQAMASEHVCYRQIVGGSVSPALEAREAFNRRARGTSRARERRRQAKLNESSPPQDVGLG